MQSFNDNKGRPWILEININTVRRVRTALGVNLLDVVGGELLEKLTQDPVLLCDILYVILKPRADEMGITDEEFGAGLCGDAISHATTAFLEAVSDFFPSEKRKLLKTALAKIKKYEQAAVELASKKLNDPALDAQFRKLMEATSNGTSGNWPGLSASIPAN